MAKTNTELLLTYKKANKAARIKIVQKSGFSTEQDYLNHLLMPDAVEEEKPTIHNVIILDASGSMSGSKFNSAVQGIRSEINELRVDDTVNYTQTIVTFSDSSDIRTEMYKMPIGQVGIFNSMTRGTTAMNQAIGQTLERLREDHKSGDKVLVKIFTDGMENASMGKYASRTVVAQLIKDCENLGFTVTFMGTASDVAHVVRNLNVDDTNTMVHDNTARGITMSFMASTDATKTYTSNVKARVDVKKGFFKKLG